MKRLALLLALAACGGGSDDSGGSDATPVRDVAPVPMDVAPDAMIDAAPDAASDAPPDAASDAPPGGAWMLGRTSYDFGVIPAGVGFTQAANIGVINTGTTSLTTSASVTPGFTLVGTPGTVPPGHELYARVLPDASNTPTPPGPLSGTLTLTVDGVPTGIPLTGDIEGAFAESLFVQSSAFTITGLAHCGGATTAMWCAPAGTDVAVTLGGYGPTYHATWSNPAPAYKITGINEQLIGMWVRDLAIAPDHHIAVGGRFTQSMRFPVIVYP